MDNAVGMKIKSEPLDEAAYGLPGQMDMPRLEEVPGRMADHREARAAEAYMGGVFPAFCPTPSGYHGDAYAPPSAASVKTPKYTAGSNWEAFHAQFELLASARRWEARDKALQLALYLEGDAFSCLLLLDPEQWGGL